MRSPLPEFETDADGNYIIITIRIHEGFETENSNFNQKNERSLSEEQFCGMTNKENGDYLKEGYLDGL